MEPEADSVHVDDIPCGYMVTNQSREIIFANLYIANELDWSTDQVIGANLETLMSRASHIYCESYVYPMLLRDGACQEIQLTFRDANGRSVPMVANAKTRGSGGVVWSLSTAQNRNRLNDELVKARNYMEEQAKKLAVLASIDDLTGLLNRRAFNEKVERRFRDCARAGTPFSLVMIDVDNFKLINDTHGHQFGDKILERLGKCLAGSCRKSDLAGRFGGEEFMVALYGKDAATAYAQRVHKAVAAENCTVHPLTVSIGVASHNDPAQTTYQELLKQADEALYRAKSNGKNQTAFACESPNFVHERGILSDLSLGTRPKFAGGRS